jgi:hypothetical protein
VKWFNRNVGSTQSTLQKRPEILDSVSVNILFYVALKMIDDLVNVAILKVVVAAEFVGMNLRSGFDHFAHDLFRDVLFAGRNHGSFNFAAALQHSHDYGFAMSALHPFVMAEALALRLVHKSGLAADEGFVHFNRSAVAAEFGNAPSLQSKAETMQNEPRGLLGNADRLSDLVRTDPVFAVHEHPERGQPFVQFDRGIFEYGAQLYRELLVALFALPALLGRKVVVLFMATGRAFRAIWPAEAGYGVNADLLVREVPDRSGQCLWLFHD